MIAQTGLQLAYGVSAMNSELRVGMKERNETTC